MSALKLGDLSERKAQEINLGQKPGWSLVEEGLMSDEEINILNKEAALGLSASVAYAAKHGNLSLSWRRLTAKLRIDHGLDLVQTFWLESKNGPHEAIPVTKEKLNFLWSGCPKVFLNERSTKRRSEQVGTIIRSLNEGKDFLFIRSVALLPIFGKGKKILGCFLLGDQHPGRFHHSRKTDILERMMENISHEIL